MLPADQASSEIERGTEAESDLTAWAEERKDEDDGWNEYGLKMCMCVRYESIDPCRWNIAVRQGQHLGRRR